MPVRLGLVASRHKNFSISQLSLVTRHCALAESGHENIYAIDHNSVRDIDRDFLICAKPRRIAGCRHKPDGSSRRSTESAGDDEADDGDVEAQREPQASLQPRRQLELHYQVLDESRSERQAGRIK